MEQIYINKIKAGRMTIEQVPSFFRESVREKLTREGYFEAVKADEEAEKTAAAAREAWEEAQAECARIAAERQKAAEEAASEEAETKEEAS